MSIEPFERVVAEHGPVVLRVCRALLGPVDADDAWSDAFLAALRAYPDLPPGSNVRGWLVTIAHNKAVDHLRASARRPQPSDALPEQRSDQHVPEPDDPELRAALDALTPRQRHAVVAHHVGGLPYAAVADLLGTSEAAARRSAADGIANLRKTYGRGPRP